MQRLGENEKCTHYLKSKAGTPRNMLEDNIKMNLRYIGLEYTDWNLFQSWVFAFHLGWWFRDLLSAHRLLNNGCVQQSQFSFLKGVLFVFGATFLGVCKFFVSADRSLSGFSSLSRLNFNINRLWGNKLDITFWNIPVSNFITST